MGSLQQGQIHNGSIAGLGPRGPNFAFECPVAIFKSDDAPAGKQKRIAGIISTDKVDRQNERILQDGLIFDDFLSVGFFNDNHGSGTTDVIGLPSHVQRYDLGDKLPDGTTADANCTWVEGYLLDTKKAEDIWELATALAKTNRRMGYSVEGNIIERTGPNDSVIAKASVRNVALTTCPVNCSTKLEILARSLSAVNSNFQRSMTLADSSGSAGPATPNKAYTGTGAGQVVSKENLAGTKKRRRKTQNLTRSEAVRYVKSRVAGASEALARAIVAATHNPLGRGK